MIADYYHAFTLLLWGGMLGLMYFGGLWLTVSRLSDVKNQPVWMLSSFVLRNLLAVAGFYPVVLQGWRLTLLCLAGFIIVRFIFIRRINAKAC